MSLPVGYEFATRMSLEAGSFGGGEVTHRRWWRDNVPPLRDGLLEGGRMSPMRKVVPVWALAVVVVAGVWAAQAAGGGSAGARQGSSVPAYDHVMVVVEENHGFADVIGNPAAPNLNYLAKTFGLATNYFGVSHPSEPNYVGLLGGSSYGVSDDNPYYVNKFNAASLISEMDAAGISWKA